ncbi:serum response factor-like isoform X2 [Portunus trituberculatus]|uniref:serum response factor-like isoform X2 n=1 Tax=Portunus trituberculatus TaxID=210409 RepID=UPI001E1CB8F8|nr:serum response factor-like isoform X2 [Portunus trituberculatus]
MQSQSHYNVDDKFGMNIGSFDPELFSQPMGAPMAGMGVGTKRSAHDAGLDRDPLGLSSDEDGDLLKKDDKMNPSSSREVLPHQTSLDPQQQTKTLPNGKKTKGRVKIKMEFIDNKLRRYTTFSKRKTGIMKKAYELSTLTGTQVMLLVASETGHVYTFATRKLQPMITSEAGKALIQTCLNSPDPPQAPHHHDQRMSATGFEETELTYAVNEDEHKEGLGREEYLGGGSSSPSDSSSPPTPSDTPTPSAAGQGGQQPSAHPSASQSLPVQLTPGLVLASSVPGSIAITTTTAATQSQSSSSTKATAMLTGGSVVVGSGGGSVMYAAGGGVVYAAPQAHVTEGATPVLLNLPPGLQVTNDQNGPGTGPLVTLPMALTSAALQQSAAAVVVSAASVAAASNNSSSKGSTSQAAPTDLSMHIKREKRP